MAGGDSLAAKLRWWRQRRGLSQLELAGRADVSQRHLSFIELGRSSPSRDMVMRLGSALDLSLREQNTLLLAAGYAPQWRESPLGAPELQQVAQALQHMLHQQEPFPAVVVDRRWNLLNANAGAVRLVEFLAGPLPPGTSINLADALMSPEPLRPFVANWAEVARYFIRSVEADAWTDGTQETATLLDRLMQYSGVQAALRERQTAPAQGVVLPMHFQKGGVSLRLFTTIATLGTPQDITLQELRIENFFPIDEETAAIFRGWSNGQG